MPVVIVYTTDRCARCKSAKLLLARRGIAYEEIDLAKDPDGWAELQQRAGMLTFPKIVIDDETLGGYEELIAADQAGRLSTLLTN
jgi:glutaredoxin 3